MFSLKFLTGKKPLNILDKYVINQLFVALIVVLFVLVGIAWLSQVIRLIEFFFTYKLSFFSFLLFSSFLIPKMISIVLPLSMLISTLFVYNRLIVDRELLVMKSVGMNSRQLFRPLKLFTIWVFCFLIFLNSFVLPLAERMSKTYKSSFVNNLSKVAIKEKTFNEVVKGLTVYIDHSKGNNLYDIFIYDRRDQNNLKTVYAEKGQIVKTSNGFSVKFVKGSLHQDRMDNYDFGTFDYYNVDLGNVTKKDSEFKRAKELYIFDLFNPLKYGFVSEKNKIGFFMAGHKRLLTPSFVFVFAFMALAFVLKSGFRRTGSVKPAMFAGVIAVLYYFIYISALESCYAFYDYIWILYVFTIISIYIPYKFVVHEKGV